MFNAASVSSPDGGRTCFEIVVKMVARQGNIEKTKS
jgi:hypothetical protein